MREEIIVKCFEFDQYVRLHVYFFDGEPTGCEYLDETPGCTTYMRNVSLPIAIQDALLEHWYETIMRRYAEYQYDKIEFMKGY